MPRVPVYEEQVAQAPAPAARVNLRVTPEDFGAGVAQGVEQLGAGLAKATEKVAKEARDARLMDSYAKLGNERMDLEKAIGDIHGSTALEQDLPAIARDRLKEAADKIAADLPDTLKIDFRRQYLQDDHGLRRTTEQHTSREVDAFAEVSHTSAVDVATNKASLAALRAATAPETGAPGLPQVTDAPDVLQARQAVLDANALKAQRKGWTGTEAETSSRLADLSHFHLTVLGGLVDAQQGAAAKTYLERYGGEIDAAAPGKSNIEKSIALAGLKDRSRKEADRLWAESGGDEVAAREKASAIGDTDLYDHVVERLKARGALVDETRKTTTSQVFATALQAFNTPGPDGAPNMKLSSIPERAAAYLTNPESGREAAELWDELRRKAESNVMHGRSLAATPTEAHWQAYGKLVKDMQDRPSVYRAMNGDRFTGEVYGKVGPLIDKAMTLYKAATEPTVDKRTLAAGESKAVLEALPPDFRPARLTLPTSTEAQVWALVQERVGERKAAEWDDKKGEVPPALLKKWTAEEWASGTVKGGRYWGLLDARRVPKAVAPVKYPGKVWEPEAAPAGTPPTAEPSGAKPDTTAQVDAQRVQADWAKRFPGRPPLTPAQVQRVLEKEQQQKGGR